VADDEFLKEIGDGGGGDADAGVFEGKTGVGFILVGIVKVGDAPGGERASDVGIVGLPAAVVSFADDGVCHRIAEARDLAAGSLVKIARILMEDGGENCRSDEGAADGIGVVGAEALAVSLGALAVLGEVVLALLDAGGSADDDDGERIDERSQGKMKFLPGIEGRGVGDVADVEVGNDAEDALLFFNLHLLLRDFDLGDADLDLGERIGDIQRDQGKALDFAGVESSGERFRGKAAGSDGELKGSGRNAGKEELAVGAGDGVAGLRLLGLGELDVRSGNDRPGLVNNGAGDGAGNLGSRSRGLSGGSGDGGFRWDWLCALGGAG